jgi:hypothetical protein
MTCDDLADVIAPWLNGIMAAHHVVANKVQHYECFK